MKKLLLIILATISINVNSQIDLSGDASIVGIYPTIKITYPLYDQFIVGGSFGYNVSNYYLSDKIDLTLGIKCNEWTQLELDLGFIGGFNTACDVINKTNKEYVFHADFGAKFHFFNNMFFSIQVAYPGLAKVGLGIRLRPYNQLTIWDKQN
jgi:hypothetical protein